MAFSLASEYFPHQHRASAEHGSADFDLIAIIQQLHQHLDPRKVFACFATIMGQYLPLYGVQVKYQQHHFQWGNSHGYCIKQQLTFADTIVTMNYHLASPLQPLQSQRLHQLQQLLLQPLFNAIQFQEVSQQAMFDALTQLGNRHYYLEQVNKEIARAQRGQHSFSLITLDLDNFKQLNDHYGHQQGDDVLKTFATLLSREIRSTDQAFRMGGDEFMILVQGDAYAASILCGRILAAVEACSQTQEHFVSASLGIAQWAHNDTEQSLYQKSDCALYQAKSMGRRCYHIYTDKTL